MPRQQLEFQKQQRQGAQLRTYRKCSEEQRSISQELVGGTAVTSRDSYKAGVSGSACIENHHHPQCSQWPFLCRKWPFVARLVSSHWEFEISWWRKRYCVPTRQRIHSCTLNTLEYFMCPRSWNHGLTQASCLSGCICVPMLRKLVEPARTTVAQALGLRPMFTAGLGTLAPPSSTLHCWQASHYSRLQSHCCPCEPTLCSSVVTSQSLQLPRQKTQWENFSVSASCFILNPTSICTLWAYMVSHSVVANTVVEGPGSRWPTCTMMQPYFCLLHECGARECGPGMYTGTWMSMGDKKMMKDNLKALTRKTSTTCTVLLIFPSFVSRKYWQC